MRGGIKAAGGRVANPPGAEGWDYPAEAFELVVSRLVLRYIEDTDTVFKKIHHTLVAGGRFVFSVEHPVITSCDRGWQGNGPRQDWIVDNYFVGLQRAGFVVESVREAEPQREWFEDDDTYQRRQRIPLFLIMAGKKIAGQERASHAVGANGSFAPQ